MSGPRDLPSLTMRAVSHQTGLSEHTLRAWERRYGVPQPHRTAGGHRLYSPRDVELLTWLLAQQATGVSISQAVARWRQLEAEGHDPLRADTVPVAAPAAPHLDALREAWLTAGLAFDERAAEAVLTQAFALYPVETVCLDLLQQGLAAVGERWYRGAASVQQEHFVAALSLRRLEALILSTPPPVRLHRIVVGCAPDEDHLFGPLLLTLLLRRRGWEVVFLSARVPVEGLDATVADTRPALVVLAAEHLPAAASLAEAAHRLQHLGVTVGYGGQIFNRVPPLRCRIPAHFLGESVPEAVQTVEALIAQPPSPAGVVSGADYAAALDHYRERRPVLERQVLDELAGQAGLASHLPTANAFLAEFLAAGLALGDLSLLDADLAWLEGLLVQRGLDPDALRDYLAAYARAASRHLDERAQPLLAWLRDQSGREPRDGRG